MTETFPVIHSILDADALAKVVAERHGLSPVSCQLTSRGSNDIYRLRTNTKDFAIRVLRSGWRTDAQLIYEMEWITHLSTRGVPVSVPKSLPDGSWFFSVRAPEGDRSIVVSDWLSGDVMPSTFSDNDAERVGALVAKIHDAASDFVSSGRRPVDTIGKMLLHRSALGVLLAHRKEDATFFDAALDWTEQEIAHLPANLSRTHTHGDIHFGNVFVSTDGEFVVLDFDDCGEDWALKDLMPFIWRNQTEGLPQSRNEHFIQGYESLRPLSEAEHQAFPFFLAARHLYLLTSFAGNINRMGPVPGFDARIDHYLDMTRQHLVLAGFPS